MGSSKYEYKEYSGGWIIFKTTIIFYSKLSYIIILCRVFTLYIEHVNRSYVVYDFYLFIHKDNAL